jgi:hypothetical protein
VLLVGGFVFCRPAVVRRFCLNFLHVSHLATGRT